MRRFLTGSFLAFLMLGSAASTSAAPALQGPPPPSLLQIAAGQGDGPVSMNAFLGDPNLGGDTVRIVTGATIQWTVGSDEIHTVTFLGGRPRPDAFDPNVFAPSLPAGAWDGASYVNSGALGRGQQFSVTFAEPGFHDYVCLLHPTMNGTVQVVSPFISGLSTQANLDRQAASHFAAEHQAQVDQIYAARSGGNSVSGPNGATTWFARAGTDWRNGHLDVNAFLPGDLTVRRGDTVVWYVDHQAPHTVTFTSGGALPDPAAPARPSGVYEGFGAFNSGIIGLDNPDNGNAYALTFGAVGEFPYACVLHVGLGMTGTVTVLP